MSESRSPNKSTTVRSSIPWQLRLARAGVRALGPVSPSLGAHVLERFFLRARRHVRPAWEHAILEGGRHFLVPWDDGPLPAWSWGDGPVVLLVHGWEGRGAQLGTFVPPLVEAGFRVVAFDAPGHGNAEGTRTSLPDFALAIERVRDAVGPVHAVIAHSMGGAAATLAAARRPVASRYVFVAPPVDPSRFIGEFRAALGPDARTWATFVARLGRRYGVQIEELSARRLAPDLDAPLLVIHDEDDREVPIDDGRAFARVWPGATLWATSGLGHRRILRDPDVIARAIAHIGGHIDAARIEAVA